MPKAEVGSAKWIGNQQKLKGLQRLRWYCQACEKQCRDANGFKMHTQSESHVRQMLVIGEDPKKFVNDFSNQFLKDFINLLKTGHGEKQVQMNRFYQEYIANKEHIHMNATKWPSLTEFAKHLGREGICRVEETEKGLHISWIDNSPEALRRQEALRRKQAQDQGDDQLEQRMIREQIKRAQANAQTDKESGVDSEDRELKREDGEKIKLSFGTQSTSKANLGTPRSPKQTGQDGPSDQEVGSKLALDGGETVPESKAGSVAPVSLNLVAKPQTKNVFAQAKKKNALAAGPKKTSAFEQPKKMSEAERIMKEEMERKRARGATGFSMPNAKKQRNN